MALALGWVAACLCQHVPWAAHVYLRTRVIIVETWCHGLGLGHGFRTLCVLLVRLGLGLAVPLRGGCCWDGWRHGAHSVVEMGAQQLLICGCVMPSAWCALRRSASRDLFQVIICSSRSTGDRLLQRWATCYVPRCMQLPARLIFSGSP